jgi:hypothetical protein
MRRAAVLSATLLASALAAVPTGATTTVRYFPPGTSPPAGVPDFGLLIQGDGASEAASVRMLDSPFRFRVGSAAGPTTPGATLVAGSGCGTVSGGVECNEAGSLKITATLGGGNDSLGEASTIGISSNETMNADGGSGNGAWASPTACSGTMGTTRSAATTGTTR